jgi:glucose/arabinose dehydrogenase
MVRSTLWRGGLPMLSLLFFAGCGSASKLPESAGYGANPTLPAPESSLIPTVAVADAVGWKAGEMPRAAAGFRIAAFATGLDHPRWLYELPNGDVLVAETNAPPKPENLQGGFRDWIQGLFMKIAGARTPSPDRITLLRDADGDGVAETRNVMIDGLTSPFGMALSGQHLYIANADALVRVPYRGGEMKLAEAPVRVAALPAGRNHHWTKSLLAAPGGAKLYVGVGSNSNVAEHGMQEEEGRAAIWEIDPQTGAGKPFATGLRNPVGMDWNPADRKLWVSVNERDEIGNDLVPDYMTSVQEGGFYGWPYSYYGQTVDERVSPTRPDLVVKAIKPDYALGAHTGSLGLTFARGPWLGSDLDGAAIVGQHGSWNRKPPAGYRVIAVPFRDGKPAGEPRVLLDGFLNDKGEARGRPVGVLLDRNGGLLVADDVGNAVWRLTKVDPPMASLPEPAPAR